ncbi:2-C-methyl-D-erythritol 4-phosphate cytidylyltransferase [Dasania sp. GY-MA-18]|uniref:2-C-methyl-D-erythritol 4-phosphate cytidylyltransferase n=1 Tax=Dasania phycosphaerae TaxID=2950436 RepID=A0A9J6RQI5_9GAMM|nr:MULTISPECIES: 2-C-methyl-D-erythritol 4-phosphate cytidylyltransferase [Dasania]MCR8923990.1 2-C-methyl-D-erythritol 4-phosphate cytidylyltransferase [Dasania sp. GY-MA-18]MCZ0866424.1 2-C-methyl-D-erythritol 4-phosphate cytidylyltransferase [Dasania phycosphaerae]MCZ0870148.1 2-C-methyl-D-erythritol 4-phosphate cytidylyltransferase [Dasania phycosphaerae]
MSVPVKNYYAVVPAAGVGKRVGAAKPKQYIEINGQTVLEHTLNALLKAQLFSEIIVAVSAADSHWQQIALLQHPQIRVVEGGQERSDSVLAALTVLQAEPEDWVLVHDVARPCIAEKSIHKLIACLKNDEVGGILALPISDTVKQVGEAQAINSTLDRSQLWSAQTPQMFRYQLLQQGLQQGLAQGLVITDEASAIELLGFKPKVVEGLASNIKITRPEDLTLAAFYLSQITEED